MRQIAREAQFQQARVAIFVVAAVLLLLLSGLYAAETLKAADTPNDTTPPYQDDGFKGAITPSGEILPNSAVSVVLTILPRARAYSYLTTLRITSTVPEQFSVNPTSVSASVGVPLPVLLDSRTITWTGEFTSLATSGPITIGYTMQTPPCYRRIQPGSEQQGSSSPDPSLSPIQSSLHELINQEMVTPTNPIHTQIAIDWIGPNCGSYLPYVANPATPPPPPPTPVPVFPALTNGNFEQGPNAGWTQQPAVLVYATSTIPTSVRGGAKGSYVAWLGGSSNSNDRLSQKVTIPAVYNTKLKLSYFTASEEAACDSDTAFVYIVSSNKRTPKQYPLCKSQATNGWRTDIIDLTGFNGEVTLLFESKLNGARNSNWFLDDIALCNAADPNCK